MAQPDDPVVPLPSGTARCPICGKPVLAPHRPFCSPRCADIDLHRWFSGRYRVETEDPPDGGAEDSC